VQEWHGAGDTVAKVYNVDNVVQETRKGRTFGRRRQPKPECNNGIRDQGLRQQLRGSKRIMDIGGRRPLYLRKARTTANGIGGCSVQQSHLGSGGTLKKALYEIFRGKKAKQIAESYVDSQKIKDWTLWKDRPPPKWLKSHSHV
jgi:hypothetical protein